MEILVAPNAFKNSLDAQAVAEAIAEGLMKSPLDCTCTLFPVADGGDGTASLIIEQLKGTTHSAEVGDPLGRPITANFGLIDNGSTAVIEMADASGLRLLKPAEPNPMQASSAGMGQLILKALDAGARKIILGMGGSATVDGGMGALSALGAKFLNEKGEALEAIPQQLIDLAAIDASGLDSRIKECEIVILCDVDNQLCGEKGAAVMFGPQKGASQQDVPVLDKMLANFAAISLKETGKDITAVKHGGAAGGAAAGLHAFLNAELVSGAPYFLDLTGFDAALQNADMVITGEGAIDEQTLHGKAPAAVAKLAKDRDLLVIGFAGKLALSREAALDDFFDVLIAIGNQPANLADAMKDTHDNLVRTANEFGRTLAIQVR